MPALVCQTAGMRSGQTPDHIEAGGERCGAGEPNGASSRRLIAHAAELCALDVPAVLPGIYNVVPTEQDIYPTKSWAKDALLQLASRAAFRRPLDQGWTDAIRMLHPSEPMYTFWDYERNRSILMRHLHSDHRSTSCGRANVGSRSTNGGCGGHCRFLLFDPEASSAVA